MTKTPAINQGFILCAGLGTRMRPLTNTMPKPMVSIDGKPMIDHVLDDFSHHCIQSAVINTHYLPDVLENHLGNRHDLKIHISREDVLLDTGGGLVQGLRYINTSAFFVSSGDSFLQNGPNATALERLEQVWNPEKMDILILLQPVQSMTLTEGVGDYDLDKDGHAIRSHKKSGAYMFTSLRVNKTAIFDQAPVGAFSYLSLLDRAEKQGRLFGLVHDGQWHHISTPSDAKRVNEALSRRKKGGAA